MYSYKDHKQAQEMLRRAGFTHLQMDRLSRFRKNFIKGDMDQTPCEHRRLEFARWLFLRGRITDSAANDPTTL